MSRGKLWKIIAVAVFIIDAIMILVNVSNLLSYGSAEAEVTKIDRSISINYAHEQGTLKDHQVPYNYLRYSVNGKEYKGLLIGDCGAEEGGTITVRYKPSDPSVILTLEQQKPVGDLNAVLLVAGALCLFTGIVFDKADEASV